FEQQHSPAPPTASGGVGTPHRRGNVFSYLWRTLFGRKTPSTLTKRKQPGRSRTPRLVLERLEDRTLPAVKLAASLALVPAAADPFDASARTLVVTGDGAADAIRIRQAPGQADRVEILANDRLQHRGLTSDSG